MLSSIRTPKVNWHEQAWDLSNLLTTMPDAPPNGGQLGWLRTMSDKHQADLERLQQTIVKHLTVRMMKYYKVFPIIDGKQGGYYFNFKDPQRIMNAYREVAQMGAKYTPGDLMAIHAQFMIATILIDRFVCPLWARQLPLIVAGIAGDGISKVAATAAAQPRPRPHELRDAKRAALKKHPSATWKELLAILTGDGLVFEWDDKAIRWQDQQGVNRTTATGTFRDY